MEELGPAGNDGSTGGVTSTLHCAPRRTSSTQFRRSTSVRSSSVRSNSSTGSRRSPSPSTQPQVAGSRPSPRLGGGPALQSGRLSSARRLTGGDPLKAQASRTVTSVVRSSQPLQSSYSASSLLSSARGAGTASVAFGGSSLSKLELSPRSRFSATLTASGSLGSARLSRAGAPPPHQSPRHIDPPRTAVASRRQNVAAVRARLSPRSEAASRQGTRTHSAFLREDRIDECEDSYTSPTILDASGLLRSTSLVSIKEPLEEEETMPPLLPRGGQEESSTSARETDFAKGRYTSSAPTSSRLPSGPAAPVPQMRPQNSARLTRPSYGGSLTTTVAARRISQTGPGRSQGTRSGLPLESATAPAWAAGLLSEPVQSDAGSGGTVGGDALLSAATAAVGGPDDYVGHGVYPRCPVPQTRPPIVAATPPRSLAASWSTPLLDSARGYPRDSPLHSARSRHGAPPSARINTGSSVNSGRPTPRPSTTLHSR